MPADSALFQRRTLPTDLSVAEVISLLNDDVRAVALAGDWAGGGAILAARPVTRIDLGHDPFTALDRPPSVQGCAEAGVGGGWFGYFGYQLGRRLERVGEPCGQAPPNSDFDLAFYDNVVRYGAREGKHWFEFLWTDSRDAALEARYRELVDRMSRPAEPHLPACAGSFDAIGEEHAHLRRIRRTIEHIHAGDVVQVNMCMHLEAEWSGCAASAFAAVAEQLRPPYAAYLRLTDGSAIVCLSPELFLRRVGRVGENATHQRYVRT